MFCITVAVLGVLVTSIAYLASVLGGSVIKMVLIFRGACGGPLLGVFLLGLFFPWSNTKVARGKLLANLRLWLFIRIQAQLLFIMALHTIYHHQKLSKKLPLNALYDVVALLKEMENGHFF